MLLASVRKRILSLGLDKNLNLLRRFYGRDPRVLVRQRNATGVSRAVDHARDHGAEVDRDRLRPIIDAIVVTAITSVEAEGGGTVIKIVVPTEEWIDKIEVQLLLVFCEYNNINFLSIIFYSSSFMQIMK